ncbi:MAG: hypothetical protein IJK84_00615 [Bacteroidales bacterium]|nr:hypothetical protein [Bacteroidales bacterium]
MKKKTIIMAMAAFAATAVTFTSCQPDNVTPTLTDELAEETYAGGRLGTTFNQSASAFEDPTPAVENAGMVNAFKYGEFFFEHTITQNNPPFNGLGPLYVRSSCEACHPGYGHGRRMERYRADDWANGYLLVVYNKTTDAYEPSVAGMPQTKAVAPFKPSIDEEKINIAWLEYTDEWGNRFPDGESYSLIYPEVTIPEDAFYAPLSAPYSQMAFRLESTIGIYGTGLLDAIPDDSLKAQYQKEYDAGANLNPAIWAGHDWASYYGNTNHPKRFTYALSRGPLQDAAGANAIWNIPNVTRSDRRSHYLSLNKSIYANTASNDPEVQAQFYNYFPQWNKTGDPQVDIYNYLMCDTLPIEMSDKDYVNFMVWHRGLAVPAARNLSDTTVQRGRKLFRDMGCATCHRPSWTTGPDNYTDPNGFFVTADARLPRYPFQKIWPYTDMVQHRLFMVNDIRTGWCRTTPLWGRGLSQICSGHSDRLHDCRARNVIEAIMWHGSPESDARWTVENFRKLSKSDRDAVVKFINAI